MSTYCTSNIMSNTLMNIEYSSKPGRKKKIKDEDKCLVCGDKSIGLNFGVHSCSPCKAFFRRNAVKLGTHEFQCRGDGNCQMNSDTRRLCNCCRLAKCFRVGMDRRSIRTDDQRLERNRLIEFNRQKRSEKVNDDEKTLETVNKQIMIRPSSLSMNSQTDSFILSINDHDLLTNMFHSYEQTCMPFTLKEHVNMPVDGTLTLEKFLNASASMYMSLIIYFKSIPEFSNLPIQSKLSLIKNNLNQICRIHSTLIMKIVTPDLDKDSPVFLQLFPEELYYEIRATSTALIPFVNDPILLKLFLTVLMLSTHLNIQYEKNQIEIDDEISTRNIFHIQNIYIELLWRYIRTRYSNYRRSVLLLTSFITRTLYSQLVQEKMNNFVRTILPSQSQSIEPIIKSLWISKKEPCC